MDNHQETLNLVEAISLMTEKLKCHDDKNGKAKAKDPDTFNGSNPHKLDSFLLYISVTICPMPMMMQRSFLC